jgi:hypothetical protein
MEAIMTPKLHGVIASVIVIGAVVAASSARAELMLDFSVQGAPPALTADVPQSGPGTAAAILPPAQPPGGVVINSVTAESFTPGTPGVAQVFTLVDLFNSASTAETVTITTDETGFNVPTVAPLNLTNSTTNGEVIGTLSYTFMGCVGPGNSLTACGVGALHPTALTASNLTAANSPISNSDTLLITSSLTGPFSLSQTLTLTLGAGALVHLENNTTLAPAPLANTPLPTTLPLFASGLGALGLLGWRRKRKARVSLLGAA